MASFSNSAVASLFVTFSGESTDFDDGVVAGEDPEPPDSSSPPAGSSITLSPISDLSPAFVVFTFDTFLVVGLLPLLLVRTILLHMESTTRKAATLHIRGVMGAGTAGAFFASIITPPKLAHLLSPGFLFTIPRPIRQSHHLQGCGRLLYGPRCCLWLRQLFNLRLDVLCELPNSLNGRCIVNTKFLTSNWLTKMPPVSHPAWLHSQSSG